MSYVPSKVPSVQEFTIVADWQGLEAVMVCQGCQQVIHVTTLQQAVAQADLHEQEKHLVDLYEVPGEVPQAV